MIKRVIVIHCVHCRVGSLEITTAQLQAILTVHCRVGSLEKLIYLSLAQIYSSLPSRQLRNAPVSTQTNDESSLPSRQLRNPTRNTNICGWQFTAE